ncbi:MAG: DUF5329 domain-containing protein [Aquabacterium sp.]|nr:DUF5329 domain-containing protein [Aquabacterium sp.]
MATPVEPTTPAWAAAGERRHLLRLLAAGALAWAGVAAAAPPPAEMARIDRLLTAVAARKDIRMVRNGRDYDTTMACEFLRRKLSTMGGEVRTAEEFIERIATRSSTTGQLYWVRLSDGRDIPAGDFLRVELVRLDKTG